MMNHKFLLTLNFLAQIIFESFDGLNSLSDLDWRLNDFEMTKKSNFDTVAQILYPQSGNFLIHESTTFGVINQIKSIFAEKCDLLSRSRDICINE